MHWLYFLLFTLCLGLAMNAALPTWAVLLLVLAALGFVLAWMLGWLSARMAGRARDELEIITPDELRRLREQAEARKSSAQGGSPGDP